MEQYLVFTNAINAQSIEVLDLYVYNLGIVNGQIPMSTIPIIRLPQGVEVTARSGESGTYQFFFNNTPHSQNLHLEGQKIHLTPFEMKILMDGNAWV